MKTKDDPRSVAPNTLMAPCAFINDAVLTKRGDLYLVLSLTGADPECMDKADIRQYTQRWEKAQRVLGPGYRVYQHVFKRAAPPISPDQHTGELGMARTQFLEQKRPELFSVELYLVILRERPAQQRWSVKGIIESLSVRKKLTVDERELKREYDLLSVHANSIAQQLEKVVAPKRLGKAGTLHFLRKLTNLTDWKQQVYGEPQDFHLDQQACVSSLETWPRFLRQDDYYLKYMSMVEQPGRTGPYLLRDLLAINCNLTICVEWAPQSNDKVFKFIKKVRRHHHLAKTSMVTSVNLDEGPKRPDEVLVDTSKTTVVGLLNDALEQIEVKGNFYGKHAITVALYHQDESHLLYACAKVAEVFGTYDAKVVEESLNMLNCWALQVPGNYAYSHRQVYTLNTNYSDMSFLFCPSEGSRHNAHLKRPHLAVLETQERTPYYLNLHVGEVGHTAILGRPDAGKSFLMNFLISSYQQYDPYTVIFDLGGSYKRLTEHYGGAYLHVGKDNKFTINPFCLPPTKENLDFLFAFVRVLIERDGFSLNADERKDLFRSISDLYTLDPKFRKLSSLLCAQSYAPRLQEWTGTGRLGSFFDHAADTLSFQRFQTFDFEGLADSADVMEPMLFYVLHRANAIIYDPAEHTTPKFFGFDEAWKFLGNEVIQDYIREALKTWRKRNGICVLATQSLEDLRSSGLLPVVSESCQTRLFLSNPGMDPKVYGDAFQLNTKELELIRDLIPKKQLLLKQTHGSKVLNLNPDPQSLYVFTNTTQTPQGVKK